MEGGISMFYPKKLIVPVFVCAVLAGVGLHFLYARFPCTLSALLSPVCESLWEHIKILYWPYLAASAFLAWGRPTGMRPWAAVPCHPVSPDAGPGPAAPCGARPPRPVAGHRPVSGADGLRFWFPVRFSGPFRGWRWRIPAILAFLLGALILLFTFFPPAGVLFADLS